MSSIYYVTTGGKKLPVTKWTITKKNKAVINPSGKYTVITSDGKGGVNIDFHFR